MVELRRWVRARGGEDHCEISSDGYRVCKLHTQAGGYIVYAPNNGAWIPETASGTIKGAKAYLDELE